MNIDNAFFDSVGLRPWCDAHAQSGPVSLAQLLSKAAAASSDQGGGWNFPFPSLDALNADCAAIPRTRDLTTGIEQGFLHIRHGLKLVLDPITQPLSWMLQLSLHMVEIVPWWLATLALLAITYGLSRSKKVTAMTAALLFCLGLVDYLHYALQTTAIVLTCTLICIVLGIPAGIAMSKSDRLKSSMLPVLDMLQTLPSFVYLIPLIFLFSVTDPKLYGIAIILYAIVPMIRLTDLGIRQVDGTVGEAASAFGMSWFQKLVGVELPLALPSIMAGVNQTIMMSLSMVVIASLVSAPGLGVLVLRGINNLELGVGLLAGLSIVFLAILFDRVTKVSMSRLAVHKQGGQQ
ncbi:glycine/betaine ABC transporter permease [Burkholderia sp. Nafp2/4-1b]|uniref:ABC transporter permease n=1 Tax=Burkholderia sp. Nafp2/4-1b TaxID=2116686 RepID=UPI000EF8D41A|nr:ABC transporter permease subunit [Burkholderia sp. Nafp2/4-1b]RKU00082.1 glycine/betaine ABC transporter permease [Burkholderia sp. Nafp2/4-1b]